MERIGSKPIDELISLAVGGDGRAFTILWDTNIEQLRAYIKGWLRSINDQDVDDICSRSFEKAFRQIEMFDSSKGQFLTWLRSIAHNTALDLLEAEGRVHPKSQTVYIDGRPGETAMANMIQDQVDTPLESIIKTETHAATEQYIEALPELYREVAKRRLLDGMQYREISETLNMELNTVRTRIRRAKALIEQMKEDDED